jgi:hypothetical protein
MIDYKLLKIGDKLRIVGAGAPGFAKLGDTVTVESCNGTNRCDVVHDVSGEKVYFALTCGAARLEPIALTVPPRRPRPPQPPEVINAWHSPTLQAAEANGVRSAGDHGSIRGDGSDRVVDEVAARPPASPPALEAWQPITTAPTDGTLVLLWWPFWAKDRPTIGWFGFHGVQQWYSIDVLEGDGDPPTHWLPLPAAPQRQEPPSHE